MGADAPIRSTAGFQRDFGCFAVHLDRRPERLRGLGQTLEDVGRSRACCEGGQAASVQELVAGVRIVNIGLALTDVVQNDGPKRNRFE
jgi:hypothetical protein